MQTALTLDIWNLRGFISAYVSEQMEWVVFIIKNFLGGGLSVILYDHICLSGLSTITLRLGKLPIKYQNPFNSKISEFDVYDVWPKQACNTHE